MIDRLATLAYNYRRFTLAAAILDPGGKPDVAHAVRKGH
jgi:hypothetical protein